MYLCDNKGNVIEVITERLDIDTVTKDLYMLINMLITCSQYDNTKKCYTLDIDQKSMERLIMVRQDLGG